MAYVVMACWVQCSMFLTLVPAGVLLKNTGILCIDMRMDMRMDMPMDMRMDMRMDMWHAYGHA